MGPVCLCISPSSIRGKCWACDSVSSCLEPLLRMSMETCWPMDLVRLTRVSARGSFYSSLKVSLRYCWLSLPISSCQIRLQLQSSSTRGSERLRDRLLLPSQTTMNMKDFSWAKSEKHSKTTKVSCCFERIFLYSRTDYNLRLSLCYHELQ